MAIRPDVERAWQRSVLLTLRVIAVCAIVVAIEVLAQ